jgi:hypothetical protein
MVLFGWGWVILRWGSVDLLLLGQHLVGVGICVHIRYSGWRWFFVLPNGRSVPPSAGYLKRHQVTKCPCSWLGPTPSGSFTPATLRGPAAIRHPWRGAALAASMPLGPLHVACVQPAPKSRLVSSGLLRTKIKINGNGNGDGKHRTCSRPACRRWRFHIRHPRPNGTPPGHTATRRGACIYAQ